MNEIKNSWEMNGVSISWAVRFLVFGFALTLIALGLQLYFLVFIAVLLLLASFAFMLSKTKICFDSSTRTLHLSYSNLFKRKKRQITFTENDYLTFTSEVHHFKDKKGRAFSDSMSTNWYPVKNVTYLVILKSDEFGEIILTDCVDLKETYAFCNQIVKQTKIRFVSPF